MEGKEANHIQVYRKKSNTNLGIVIFGVIFIYLVITVLTYVTAKHVSVYEVREGTILRDNAFTGIILREEAIVYADADGYVNYFVTEGSKVGRKSAVYCLSAEELQAAQSGSEDNGEAEDAVLALEDQELIIQKIQTFLESFQENQYRDTYALKDSVENMISNNSNQNRQVWLGEMINSGQEGLALYTAADDGIILYSVDGYEQLTKEQVTAEMIARADYQKTELLDNQQVKTGEPVYKLVTSEDWMLAIELDDALAEELADVSSVQVRFSKDHETTWAALEIDRTKDSSLAFLSFDRSMIRYAGERFLDIELILEDVSGLKIPKTAVIEKEFYPVPEDYITQGANNNNSGVLVQKEKGTAEFKNVEIYDRDVEAGIVYLDPNSLDKNTVLVKPDSNDTYRLEKTDTLKGVYNIDKGYAVFRPIHILCESEEYYIVESEDAYGLSNYDHIALDGESVHENDIVLKKEGM